MKTTLASCLSLIALVVSSQGRAGLLRPCTPEPAPVQEPPAAQRQAVSWIVQAIEDEIEAWRGYDDKRVRESDSDEALFFRVPGGQHVLVEPFDSTRSGVVVHVLYPLPDVGWVLREAALYPDDRLALFWLGYSVNGPGLNTGFNCTHTLSNCKLQSLDFDFIRRAFSCWWVAQYRPLGRATSELAAELGRAKGRNAQRRAIILKWQEGQ